MTIVVFVFVVAVVVVARAGDLSQRGGGMTFGGGEYAPHHHYGSCPQPPFNWPGNHNCACSLLHECLGTPFLSFFAMIMTPG